MVYIRNSIEIVYFYYVCIDSDAITACDLIAAIRVAVSIVSIIIAVVVSTCKAS